jgi:hypothetical protein
MKIKDNIIRKYIAVDGKEFDSEKLCLNYETKLAKKQVGESSKYVVGVVFTDGTGYFQRYKKQTNKGIVRMWGDGGTSNVKYAYKFDTFEEAFKRGGDRVLTLEEAQKASDVNQSKKKKVDEREQRYVKVFTAEHTPEDGTYITDVGLGMCIDGKWSTNVVPAFWMKKVNKTAK